MYVRSLKLSGFKSFADPTVLDFERGVNVIVGPNGSGKSNIADALSWVLGSQAPSSLRGASMEDVIFAGSTGRPRLGYATVDITLDNSSRILPLDLAEVTISRSTDRAGVSEYKINGAVCRLLDVTELLSDTGIGRSIHTVVGQGQLDAVLQARPEDRRAFIEEAAQIGKFRKRKDRSLRKIERVDENLLRLNDVLVELRRSVRPLKRQASAAAMYTELMAEHRELRQRLAATELRRLSAENQRIDPEEEARVMELLNDELKHIRARLEGVAGKREELADNATSAQQLAYRMARACDRLDSLSRVAAERVESFAARLAAETEEGYRERIRLLDLDRSRWERELESLREVAESSRSHAEAAHTAAIERGEVRSEAEAVLARARTQETQAAQALVRAEGSEAAGKTTLGSLEARVHSVAERREVAAAELIEDKQAVEVAAREVQSLESDLDAAVTAAATAESALETAREEADAVRARLADVHAERAAADARLAAFQEVIDLFVDRADVRARVEGLSQGARAQAQIAWSSEEDAAALLREAEKATEARWQDVARHDEELRRLDAIASGAAERLLGARRRQEKREIELATLDEELARSRDALAAAERDVTEERAQLPVFRAALDEARSAREEAERQLANIREEFETARKAAETSRMEARTAEERSLAAQLRVEEAQAGIAEAEQGLAGLEGRRQSLRFARSRAAAVAQIASEAAARGRHWTERAEARAGEIRAEAAATEKEVTDLRARERELIGSVEQVALRRNEAEVRRAEIRTRTEALAERVMDEWGLAIPDLMDLEPLIDEAEPEARERAEKLDREMRRLGAINPHAADEYNELAAREQFLIEQIEDLRSSKQDLMKVVREVDETIERVFDEAFQDVAREFEAVFQRLFPGGEGSLKLVDPSDLLNSGIEVEARPPGKNVRKLSLLSGGERALVALAFLFSIFRSRPSPFYLLDEVEAALDDVNLQRFLGLVQELEQRAQVLVVTHQKRTMEVADVLYGVSISKDGVSRVVSKRMEQVPT